MLWFPVFCHCSVRPAELANSSMQMLHGQRSIKKTRDLCWRTARLKRCTSSSAEEDGACRYQNVLRPFIYPTISPDALAATFSSRSSPDETLRDARRLWWTINILWFGRLVIGSHRLSRAMREFSAGCFGKLGATLIGRCIRLNFRVSNIPDFRASSWGRAADISLVGAGKVQLTDLIIDVIDFLVQVF